MNTQELKTESADMALRELNWLMHSHRMELHHTRHIYVYMRTHGESRLGSKQNWRIEKELIRKLVLELSRKWKN